MPSFPSIFLRVVILLLAYAAFGQPQAIPPKPQTARQALIEMVTKGGDSIQKHLTVEVQDILKSAPKSNAWNSAIFDSLKGERGLQSFDTGEVLFSFTDATQHAKYEVRVDNDDLAGDENSLALSIHGFRDGKEQDAEWGMMSAHFTVHLMLQQGIWRLNKVAVGTEFPIGDAKFFEKTFLKMGNENASGVGFVAGIPDASPAPEAPALVKPPEEIVRLLAVAENAFARQHPDVGFTCSLSELAQWSKMMGVEEQVLAGTYNGYRFAVGGCEGKPAGSFQITAEPVLAAPGTKAFCTDATQNVRADNNGHSAACLTSGKVEVDQTGDIVSSGWTFYTPSSDPKK